MPLELNTLLYCDERDIHGIHLRVKNEPGVLEKIVKIISGRKLNIVSVVTSIPSPSAKEADIFIGIDFTDKKELCEIVIEEMKKLNVVFEVKHIRPTLAGILFDEYLFPIRLGGKPAILLGHANMIGFLIGLKKKFGEAIAATTLYHAGYSVGQTAYKMYIAKSKFSHNPELVTTEILKPIVAAYGWCRIRLQRTLPNGLLIEAHDLWECVVQKEYYTGRGIKTATSHYVRGMLAGVFDNVYRAKTRVREIKCINLGDEYCLFEVVKL